MRISGYLLCCVGSFSLLLPAQEASSAEPIHRFDMGTADSPVAENARRVTEDTAWSGDSGFGWVGASGNRESFHRTAISESVIWRHDPGAGLVDGVASSDDLVFRVDVPNGDYTVEIQLGDLGGYIPPGMGRFLDTGVRGEASGGPGGPLFSMAVDSGDRRIATDVAARTYPHRGNVGVPDLVEQTGLDEERAVKVMVLLGNQVRVRFDEQVSDGHLELRFHGDDTTYRRAIAYLNTITDLRLKRQSMYLAGGPFTHNSVLSIVVRPTVPAPIVMKDNQLQTTVTDNEPLATFVRAFNNGELRAAAGALRAMPKNTFTDHHARVLATMWLAGHPNQWRERNMLPRVAAELADAMVAAGSNEAQLAELQSLHNQLVDLQRGIMNFDQRTKDGQEVVPSMNRAEGYFARALPGEPFYWKSKLYQARIWFSMDPNRNAQLWRHSEQILRDLEDVYPDNRWVRYYLHQDQSGWKVTDYREHTQNAPEWASETHNFYNRILDLCEWWITNRQNDDNGAIGGEWGDDVEFMPLIAYTSVICPDASPLLVEGTMRFADGAWYQSGIIDEHNGFFHLTTDAEHAAEFTGNVLGMMLQVRPGDPEYVERTLKTGKLMRDIWMGRNSQGQRLIRSGFLGAFHVPNTETDVDAAICGRAMNPVWNLLEITRNPELVRLAVEYADTLVELALSTDKGKPCGVLPGPVVFDSGELGSRNSDNWWLAPEGPFQGMFTFPDYHNFRLHMLATAWRLTGDDTYLEPIRLESELIEQHYPREERERDRAKREQLTKAHPDERVRYKMEQQEYKFGPEAGSKKWVARLLSSMGVESLWEELQWETKGTSPETKGVLLDPTSVARNARRFSELAEYRWPMMTDDATMTDRVGFSGCNDSFVWYAGGRQVAQQYVPAVTWEGPGREFAALVERHNSRFLRLRYYGFHDAARDVTLRFWELEPGGTYQLKGGLDTDGDNRPDSLSIEEEFVLDEPSGGIDLTLEPGQTWLFEVRQVDRGQTDVDVTDPAIAARDIRFDPRGHLLVDVHNIGNVAAENIEVRFYEGDPDDGGRLLGRTIVSHVEPPNTLQPQIVRTGIEWSPTEDQHTITVVLDEDNKLTELFERNNRATTSIER